MDTGALAYKGAGQLTSTTAASGGSTTSYSYAGDANVLRTQAGGTTFRNGLLGVHSFTTAGQTTHVARDPAGNLVSLLAPNGSGTTTYHYVFDGQANVVGLVDSSGAERARYTYGPYGEDATATAVGGTLPTNPYRFAGEYLDPTGHFKIGLRYYNPTQATWTQTDSISTLDHPARANPYTYAGGDPANNTDPTGAFFDDIKDAITDPDAGDILGVAANVASIAAPLAPGAVVAAIELSGATASAECTSGTDGECTAAAAGFGAGVATLGVGAASPAGSTIRRSDEVVGAAFGAYSLLK